MWIKSLIVLLPFQTIDFPFEKMGLDIRATETDISACVGSYSSVHSTRHKLVEYTIEWLKRNRPQTFVEKEFAAEETEQEIEEKTEEKEINEGRCEEAIKLLEQWIQQTTKINYGVIDQMGENLNVLAELGIQGVLWFTNHSDCDGHWSTGQALDISLWMAKLQSLKSAVTPFQPAENDSFLAENDSFLAFIDTLKVVFDAAVKQNSTVQCC